MFFEWNRIKAGTWIGLILLVSGCPENSTRPINIAGNKWLGYQPLYVAHHLGMLNHDPTREHQHTGKLDEFTHHFSINMLPSTSSVMRMMSNGQIDIAMLTLDEALIFQSTTGKTLCVPLVMDYSFGADALLVNQATFDAAGRNNIRIGFESTALGGYMVRQAMDYLGVDLSRIEPVSLEPHEQVEAYRSGKVDAVVTYEPYLGKIKAMGASERFSTKMIPAKVIDLLVADTRIWQERRWEIADLTGIHWQTGLQLVVNRDRQAMEFIQSVTETSPDVLHASFNGIHFVDSEESRRILADSFHDAVDSMNHYLDAEGLIERPGRLAACK